MQPIIDELKQIGLSFDSLDALRRSGTTYKVAIPVLLKWLPVVTDVHAKESIVRTLSVPWAKPVAAAPLIAEFQRIADSTSGLKWVIGNALAVTADESVLDAITALVRDRQNGKAREMLVIALGNMKGPHVVDLLVELLRDDEVAGHALVALGKQRAQAARPFIEQFLNHPKAWVRSEAKKAIAKLNK
jgi:HEAT repeats